MEERKLYHIEAHWDSEAEVWVSESEDVPGLIAEAGSPNALTKKLRALIPELLELNGMIENGSAPVEFRVRYQHEETGKALAS